MQVSTKRGPAVAGLEGGPMKATDRVKIVTVKLHEEGMPFVTRYGTLLEVGDNFAEVKWDDGEVTFGFKQGLRAAADKLDHPEPIAYQNPVHPSGPKYVGNCRVDQWSATKEEYDVKVGELEEELALRPWSV